jgi:hypothetical protein
MNPRLLITPMSTDIGFLKDIFSSFSIRATRSFLVQRVLYWEQWAQPFIDLSTDSSAFVPTAEAAIASSFLQALFCFNSTLSPKPS